MSQWGGETSSQPQAPAPISFFDPSKFQKGADNFPHVPVSQQNDGKGHVQGQSEGQNQGQIGGHSDMTNQDGNQSNWNSWGAWNAENNPYAGDFNAGQQVNSDYNNYNAQQWQGQPQYNNVPLQNDHSAGQWDQNSQGAWDPNQQWNQQQQYSYQQGTNPNENTGYNNYWGGSNGDYQSNVAYQNVDQSGYIASSVNNVVQETNAQYAQTGASYGQNNTQSTELTGSVNSLGQTVQNSGDLNVSQSTEESGSLNQSVGNIEDGGAMDGFYNNDDYDEDEGDTDDDDDDDEDDDSAEEEDISNENNSNLGAAGSHIQHENEHHYEQSHNTQAQTVIPDSQTNQSEVIGQMQALNLQDNFVSQTNEGVSIPSVPMYSNQRNDGNNVNLQAAHTVPQQQPTFPPQSVGLTESNSESESGVKQTTPTFSDWEMIPSQGTVSAHSRNASIDNNVHFFISSTNSSARVSPASSKTGEEKSVVNTEDRKEENVPNRQTDINNVGQHRQSDTISQQINEGPPPSQPVGPPPPMSGGMKGVNPFRKSPNIETNTVSTANNDVSMLSSTRLDVTRPNFENSPVVLNQSISPITANIESTGQREGESPEVQLSKNSGNPPDTPVTSQYRKTTTVQQSPILPRKESPFQPPKQDSTSKNAKTSQDIPEDPAGKYVKPEQSGKQGRRTPDRDRGYRSRTPDWDSGDRNEGRRSERDSRRRTDRGYDERDRYNRDRDRYGADNDRVTSRPPSGSNTSDRSTRTRQSAFHHIQTNRNKNNVSPAASLLDVADSVPAMPNILLMPATNTSGTIAQNTPAGGAPSELNPVVSLISSMSEQMTGDYTSDSKNAKNDSKYSDRDRDSKDRYREKDRYRDRDDRGRYGKDRDRDRGSREDIRGNRSYDSLRERGLKDSRNDSREKLSMYDSRDSLDRDDSRDRTRRGDSRERDRSYRDDYYERSYRYWVQTTIFFYSLACIGFRPLFFSYLLAGIGFKSLFFLIY